jgi:hypothetical protein
MTASVAGAVLDRRGGGRRRRVASGDLRGRRRLAGANDGEGAHDEDESGSDRARRRPAPGARRAVETPVPTNRQAPGARTTGSACKRDCNLAQKSRSWRGIGGQVFGAQDVADQVPGVPIGAHRGVPGPGRARRRRPCRVELAIGQADKRSFAESSKPSIAILFLQIYR